MSGEKIDLADLAFSARLPLPPVSAEEVLALVAAVRAAREMDHAMTSAVRGVDLRTYRMELHVALTPFTDSQASPSAGEAPDSAEGK